MRRRLAAAALAAGLAVACGAGGDEEEEPGDRWRRWQVLEFEARADLPVRASLRMRVATEGDELTLATDATATLMGLALSSSRTVTRMDAASGRPTEFVSLSRRRGRRYRFEPERYVVERLEPTAGFDAPVESWGARETGVFPYPEGAPFVYDYWGMIFNMRRLPLAAPGDRAEVWVSTSDGPSRFAIVVEERRTRTRTLRDPAHDQPAEWTLDELRLRVTPLEDASDVGGFLGMRGETEIWVEANSKTLLEVRGDVRRAGQVIVELTGVAWP